MKKVFVIMVFVAIAIVNVYTVLVRTNSDVSLLMFDEIEAKAYDDYETYLRDRTKGASVWDNWSTKDYVEQCRNRNGIIETFVIKRCVSGWGLCLYMSQDTWLCHD
ncbi:MAG: hypothetical protein HUJ96_00615 [Marinilabiliaceae bacterium]|nr:hypothetical protein [Marinilabiliaceae bacterium]